MNDRSPVGQGRSFTTPSPAGQLGHLDDIVQRSLDAYVEIGRFLGEPGYAYVVRVKSEIVRERLGDGESVGEERGGQLDSDFPPGKGANSAVLLAKTASEPDLLWSVTFPANSGVAPAGTLGALPGDQSSLAESHGSDAEALSEEALVALDGPSQHPLVESVRQVEGVGVDGESQSVPGFLGVKPVSLRTARTMFAQTRKAHGIAERDAEPVASRERLSVDSTGSRSDTQPGKNYNTELDVLGRAVWGGVWDRR